jgi:hypothetical protein
MKKIIALILVSILLQNCSRITKLEKILNKENENESIIQIRKMLREKSKNYYDFESLNQYEMNILFIEFIEKQVNAGGFDQYFFNDSGQFAHETLNFLREINATKTAEILNNAIKVFPKNTVPKDLEHRQDLMEGISENWGKLDDDFREKPENLTKLTIEYVKANKKNFE